ncbi:hypothetical protein KGM_216166 [Danaus plexippus plexippus]|uniref:Uncharacterized protein n=1 Tax=Danaus plexippus plexippus TaxID=278856 RepID=A0A212EKP8_DANPL|nr:hypothetical protein KGM_216166 [Danaus plexippus plexippus]
MESNPLPLEDDEGHPPQGSSTGSGSSSGTGYYGHKNAKFKARISQFETKPIHFKSFRVKHSGCKASAKILSVT